MCDCEDNIPTVKEWVKNMHSIQERKKTFKPGKCSMSFTDGNGKRHTFNCSRPRFTFHGNPQKGKSYVRDWYKEWHKKQFKTPGRLHKKIDVSELTNGFDHFEFSDTFIKPSLRPGEIIFLNTPHKVRTWAEEVTRTFIPGTDCINNQLKPPYQESPMDHKQELASLKKRHSSEQCERREKLDDVSKTERQIHLHNVRIRTLGNEINRVQTLIDEEEAAQPKMPVGWRSLKGDDIRKSGDLFFDRGGKKWENVFMVGSLVSASREPVIRPNFTVNWDKIPEELNFVARASNDRTWLAFEKEPDKQCTGWMWSANDWNMALMPSQAPNNYMGCWEKSLIQRPNSEVK